MTSLHVPPEPTGEEQVGMLGFLTGGPGVGGRLRAEPEDFVVDEISLPPPEVAGGDHVAAVIRLRNWETNRFVRQMSRRLGISSRRVRFAGVKDKRAVTTQVFTIKAPLDSVRGLWMTDVELLSAHPTDRHVGLGDLVGNRFRISATGVELDAGEARDRAAAVLDEADAEGGFPNFYGHQRFGVARPVSHRVGEALVRGDVEGACWTYIAHPGDGEGPEVSAARREVGASRDPREGLRTMPMMLGNERTMLDHLLHHPDDHAGAIRRLPFNLQLMFIHAYQGLAFNLVLSERMRRGMSLVQPLEGDVVVPVDGNGNPLHDSPRAVTSRNLDKVMRQVELGRAVVTGAVPGTESPLAEGEMGDVEASVMQQLGITREDFRIVELTDLTSPGIRRELAITAKPELEAEGDRVTLGFALPKGCYATCVLREVMKAPLMAY